MRKFFSAFFKKIGEMLEKADLQTMPEEKSVIVFDEVPSPKVKEKQGKSIQTTTKKEIIPYPDNPIRDIIDLMEFPFLALSKDRRSPIVYESADGTQKIKISRHTGHFLASIYDWDIILIAAGKIQEILNNGSEIPSCTISIPRHELLKALHKQGGKKQQKDLEKSLDRLQLTGISTTVNNKDYRHRAGFGFVDRWGYSERKNARETRKIQITLSPWLYELCCAQGGLLKSNISYFDITSDLKKFLYRTARKHAGKNKDGWKFSTETLYKKSDSEREFKKFKSDLKAAVQDDDIPEYSMEWVEESGKTLVGFKRSKLHELERLGEECEKLQEKTLAFNNLQEYDE